MSPAQERFASLLRVAAGLIRCEHGPRCPDHADHRKAAAHLDEVAEAVESGGRLSVADVVEVEKIVRRYRCAVEPVEVPA